MQNFKNFLLQMEYLTSKNKILQNVFYNSNILTKHGAMKLHISFEMQI